MTTIPFQIFGIFPRWPVFLLAGLLGLCSAGLIGEGPAEVESIEVEFNVEAVLRRESNPAVDRTTPLRFFNGGLHCRIASRKWEPRLSFDHSEQSKRNGIGRPLTT